MCPGLGVADGSFLMFSPDGLYNIGCFGSEGMGIKLVLGTLCNAKWSDTRWWMLLGGSVTKALHSPHSAKLLRNWTTNRMGLTRAVY